MPPWPEAQTQRLTRGLIGNSKIGAEIRGVHLVAKGLVEQTVSGELDVVVRKRLTEIAQILRVYARLTEFELAAGRRPKFSEPGEYGLPDDTAGRAREWAGKEGKKEGFVEGLAAFNKNPRAAPGAMG